MTKRSTIEHMLTITDTPSPGRYNPKFEYFESKNRKSCKFYVNNLVVTYKNKSNKTISLRKAIFDMAM
jgi:hypothetical protein